MRKNTDLQSNTNHGKIIRLTLKKLCRITGKSGCGGRVGKVKDPYGYVWLVCSLRLCLAHRSLPSSSFSRTLALYPSLMAQENAATLDLQNGGAENGSTKTVSFSSLKPQFVLQASKAADAVQFFKTAFGAREFKRVMHSKRKEEWVANSRRGRLMPIYRPVSMERGMRLFSSLILVLLLVTATKMGPKVVEARTCESQSHRFKGACLSDTNCLSICQTEGFPAGDCKSADDALRPAGNGYPEPC
uniref:Defensin-like protein n=1 Tax=Nelumbo nucifera TaxID=4432 RepID=A0A822ZGR1_NELNU|nr:TPA_asm: hypothetical protein HUJ06_001910 [Nelumbo nucifera]